MTTFAHFCTRIVIFAESSYPAGLNRPESPRICRNPTVKRVIFWPQSGIPGRLQAESWQSVQKEQEWSFWTSGSRNPRNQVLPRESTSSVINGPFHPILSDLSHFCHFRRLTNPERTLEEASQPWAGKPLWEAWASLISRVEPRLSFLATAPHR